MINRFFVLTYALSMIPVVLFVGKKKSGKTTFLESVIAELSNKGYRVGTLKHHVHSSSPVDKENTDSWKHQRAGALIAGLSSRRGNCYFLKSEDQWTIAHLCLPFEGKVDIVLGEGFKQEPYPKIEVFNSAIPGVPVCSADQYLIAVVSDIKTNLSVPHFDFSEAIRVVEFIETKYLVRNI